MFKKLLILLLISSQAFALGTVTGGTPAVRKGASAFSLSDIGTPILGVRNDGNSTLTGGNLTYGPLSMDQTGKLNVNATMAEQALSAEPGHLNGSSLFKLVAGRDGSSNVHALSMTASGSVLVDGSGTTQPISAVALPLPAGAATSANQSTMITSLGHIDGEVATLAEQVVQRSLLTGILTNDSTISTSVTSLDTKTPTLGQKTMAGSSPVVIASDQSGFSVFLGGKLLIDKVRRDYSSANVTTTAISSVIASLAGPVTECEIFDSSGRTLYLIPSSGSSVFVVPGGNGRIPTSFNSGISLSLQAASANATAGEFDLNCYR